MFRGMSPFDAASSMNAKAKMPAAAGQRPSRSGYGSGSGREPRFTAFAIPATARAIARHGLNARNTSPNSTLAAAKPSQKIT
jgi:hypothetical protein